MGELTPEEVTYQVAKRLHDRQPKPLVLHCDGSVTLATVFHSLQHPFAVHGKGRSG